MSSMHWIQRHILRQLIQNPRLRYAAIKPHKVEGSLFMYHLRQLVKSGLVQKTSDNQYELTAKGRLQADNMQLESLAAYEQPRLVVLVACWDDAGRLLLFHRKTQPVIDMIGLPHVTTRLGQDLLSAAQQSFASLSGLTVSLQRRGEGYITMYRGSEPESYVFFHLLEGFRPSGKLKATIDSGYLFWQADMDFNPPAYLPSMTELIRLLRTPDKEPFFVELAYTLSIT